MPNPASTIITRAAASLNDPDNVQWTEAELIDYINDAQGQVVMARPEANPKTISMKLVAGSKQTIPDGSESASDIEPDGIASFSLIDVIRNMGANGTTPGRVIRKASMYYLDKNYPDWHTENPNAIVQNYLYDDRNRHTFYVRPSQPSAAQGWIEMVVSAIPTDISTAADNLSLEAVYEPAILAYVLYRSFMKDIAQSDATLTKATGFYTQFQTVLGLRQEAEKRQHPGNQMQVELQERGY